MAHPAWPHFLVCDVGGTETRVIILDSNGIKIGTAVSGAANATVAGIDASARTILSTVRRAGPNLGPFQVAWLGVSGADDQATCNRLHDMILSHDPHIVTDPCHLVVTNDCDLLASAIISNGSSAGITLIAGTGSNAMAFRPSSDPNRLFPLEACGRIGGWGHVLGDEGSAYWIGREALRGVLAHRFDSDATVVQWNNDPSKHSAAPSDAFVRELLGQLDCRHTDDLLADVLAGSDDHVKARIASISPLVTKFAAEAASATEANGSDRFLVNIVERACQFHLQAALALRRRALPDGDAGDDVVLVLGGALFQKCDLFAASLREQARGTGFDKIIVVDDAAQAAAEALIKLYHKVASSLADLASVLRGEWNEDE